VPWKIGFGSHQSWTENYSLGGQGQGLNVHLTEHVIFMTRVQRRSFWYAWVESVDSNLRISCAFFSIRFLSSLSTSIVPISRDPKPNTLSVCENFEMGMSTTRLRHRGNSCR
jgi:hypothetical protein